MVKQKIAMKGLGVPIGGLIGLVVIVVAFMFKLLGLAECIQILIMLGLVFVTAQYAKSAAEQTGASRKMAEEMQESRFASLQPIIVMGRTIEQGPIKDARIIVEQTIISDRTWLCNVGPGPALNLHFFLKEPNRKNPSGTFSGKGLKALGPGEVHQLGIEKRLSSHDLVVEYEDVFGRKWCSGLELNYTEGQNEFTVINLFYEKLD